MGPAGAPLLQYREFRICDVPMTVHETTAIAAMFGPLRQIIQTPEPEPEFHDVLRALLSENKWRASRYGIDGSLIDFGKEAEVNTRVLIYELLDFVDDVLNDLGSRHAVAIRPPKCWNREPGPTAGLKVFEESQNLVEVVDLIHNQFLHGLLVERIL